MKTVIIYATKYGCTEKCAGLLAGQLTGEVELWNLKQKQQPDLTQYDQVIIGGSIYIGKLRKEVSQFCIDHLDQLQTKKLGLFICSMQHGEQAVSYFETSFPAELVQRAVAKEAFGGEFYFNKMNFIERFMVRMVSKQEQGTPIDTKHNVSEIFEENIQRFAEQMNVA